MVHLLSSSFEPAIFIPARNNITSSNQPATSVPITSELNKPIRNCRTISLLTTALPYTPELPVHSTPNFTDPLLDCQNDPLPFSP